MTSTIQRSIALFLALAILSVGGWLAGVEPDRPETVATPAPAAAALAPQGTFEYVGVSSCAASACHGGTESAKQDEKWRSSYGVWAAQDRHSHAYQVLFEERAKRIVQILNGLADFREAKPQAEQRCLACHSLGDDLPKSNTGLLADGVGCEACHGPAERWLGKHIAYTWANLDPQQKYGPTTGMRNTKDLTVRAEVCVDCHVGSPAAAGRPARQVDHDLIAAGHPRLSFDFSAYLAMMPRHWDEHADRKRYADYEAKAWAIGQAVTAKAALDLLAGRAEAAMSARATGNWPDFSEYDCFACHHELKSPSFRQELAGQGGAGAEKLSRRRKLGSLPWGTWYFSSVRLLAAPGGLAESHVDLKPIDDLAATMSRLFPDPASIHALTGQAALQMNTLLTEVNRSPFEPATVERQLRSAVGKEWTPADWDEATERLLAVVALHAAWSQSEPSGTGVAAQPSADRAATQSRIAAALAEIRQELQFPTDKGQGTQPATAVRYSSPRDFQPAEIREAFDRLRKLLFPPRANAAPER